MTRHSLIEANYLNPDLHGTIELRLFAEPDPVRVVDVRSRRLMTERDVVALANLRHFAKSGAEPRHREPSRERIEELVSLLKRSIGANGGTLPQFFADAAAFWTGVRQQWPYFSAQQRGMARAYAANTGRVSMPAKMYASLWGLDRAARIHSLDQRCECAHSRQTRHARRPGKPPGRDGLRVRALTTSGLRAGCSFSKGTLPA